jgi:hypothetical protein
MLPSSKVPFIISDVAVKLFPSLNWDDLLQDFNAFEQ